MGDKTHVKSRTPKFEDIGDVAQSNPVSQTRTPRVKARASRIEPADTSGETSKTATKRKSQSAKARAASLANLAKARDAR